MDEAQIKERIMEATLEEVNDKGLNFTMNDVARRIKVSKKTIYSLFQDKESLCIETVNHCFLAIKESEAAILQDDKLPLEEKIKKILIVLPDRYANIDFRKISGGKEKYPKVYAEIEKWLNSGWEPTISLLQEGIDSGLLKQFSIPILKCMVEAAIQQFLNGEELLIHGVSYDTALNEMLDILWNGIANEKMKESNCG